MRITLKVTLFLLLGIIFLYSYPFVNAGESPDGNERVDLPEKSSKEITIPDIINEDEDEDEIDDGGEPPEEVEPPIEFWDTPVETDEVVYVVDRTGSMAYNFHGTIEDLEGNTLIGASKMEATNIELKRSIMNLSENVKFNISYYAHRWGSYHWKGGHPFGSYSASPTFYKCGYWFYNLHPGNGPLPASHADPPFSEPDVVYWRGRLMPATNENKAHAFAWIDLKGTPNGCTCISDGCVAGGLAFDTKTIFLLTDGWPNTFKGEVYKSDYGFHVAYVFQRTKTEIKGANANNVTIHTFYIPYGDPSKDPQARQLLQEIAAQNGPGTFTQIGS